jgi:hypothetical protein
MDLSDRNIGKCIAQSKEIGNLAGKAIQLSAYEIEKQKLGLSTDELIPEIKMPELDVKRI